MRDLDIEWGETPLHEDGFFYGPVTSVIDIDDARRVQIRCGYAHQGGLYSTGMGGWNYCVISDVPEAIDINELARNFIALVEVRICR